MWESTRSSDGDGPAWNCYTGGESSKCMCYASATIHWKPNVEPGHACKTEIMGSLSQEETSQGGVKKIKSQEHVSQKRRPSLSTIVLSLQYLKSLSGKINKFHHWLRDLMVTGSSNVSYIKVRCLDTLTLWCIPHPPLGLRPLYIIHRCWSRSWIGDETMNKNWLIS